jgi:hypothetical protein
MSHKDSPRKVYFFSKSPIPPDRLTIMVLKREKGTPPHDLTPFPTLSRHSNPHLFVFFLPTQSSAVYAVVKRSGQIISWLPISSHLSFPVYFLTKSLSLHNEPLPPKKRRRKVLHSPPDPRRLFAKLRLQFLDFSLTDPNAISACFDFSLPCAGPSKKMPLTLGLPAVLCIRQNSAAQNPASRFCR